MDFANPFDAALAEAGPPAIFVRTDEGTWRLDDMLTRDAWERVGPEAPAREPSFVLARDRTTGFVGWWFTTSRGLLTDHPRAELRHFATEQASAEALEALGRPAVVKEPWVMPS